MMTTCDRVLAHEIMSACVQASGILGVTRILPTPCAWLWAKFLRSVSTVTEVCANGMEDHEEAHPNHRHTSHHVGLVSLPQIKTGKT